MANLTDLHLNLVKTDDLVLVRVISKPAPQTYRAFVEKIYRARHGIKIDFLGKEIEFIGSCGSWGDVPLAVGERAIVFMSEIFEKLYEHSYHGHILLEEINGELYGIEFIRKMWLNKSTPSVLRESARQDPKRPYCSAVRFDVLEGYLVDLIKKVEAKESKEKDNRY